MVWPWYWQVGQPTQNFTVVFDTGPGVSFFFGHDVVIGSKSDEFARFWSPFPTRCFVQGKGEKDGKGNVSIQNRYSLPTACISSLYADIFWQDQVCMKHGRYDRSLSVACLRISSTFHVTLINVTNSGICRRDQRGWESSCQREAASGLPDIGKPSFHQIICIYIYIYVYIIHLQHLPVIHGYCMQSVCTHPALWLRHDMVSISYGIGEVAGDFVRDAAASGKRGSNSKTPCFCCFWFSSLFVSSGVLPPVRGTIDFYDRLPPEFLTPGRVFGWSR